MTGAAPTTANRTLRRLANSTYRQREYLTEVEVDRLIEAARKRGRNGARDAAAILLAYRHGLRAQELCSLRWSQIDLRHGRLHVNRAKGGIESVHPLHGPELRALRPLQGKSPYVFVMKQARRSLHPGSCACSNALGEQQSYPLQFTRTCYGMLAATSSPTTDMTPDHGALPRASQLAIDCALYRFGSGSVRKVLPGLIGRQHSV
jgi:integrase